MKATEAKEIAQAKFAERQKEYERNFRFKNLLENIRLRAENGKTFLKVTRDWWNSEGRFLKAKIKELGYEVINAYDNCHVPEDLPVIIDWSEPEEPK